MPGGSYNMRVDSNVLKPGVQLRTNYGTLRVLERLGGGSQGDVYRVMYRGEEKALKWYYNEWVFLNRDDFIWNLKCNIADRAKAPAGFLWPLDMTRPDERGRFGYIMDLVDTVKYKEGEEVFANPNLFSSFKRIIDVCLNITRSFMFLHDQGFVYRDISGGNFFVDPTTGDALVCDNDNVAPPNRNTGIRGTGKYRAPEVIAHNVEPTVQSDLHSLAVVIFRLLLMHHPLEGKRLENMMLDDVSLMRVYGTDPLFIFDKTDTSNVPVPGTNASIIWPVLPKHMKRIFRRAFSRLALHNPQYRPKEIEWMRELARLRSEVVACPKCGRETFLEDARARKCANPNCDATVGVYMGIEVPLGSIEAGHYVPYVIPVAHDSRIYKCQTGEIDSQHALDCTVRMFVDKKIRGAVAMRNVSDRAWRVKVGEDVFDVGPGRAIYAGENRELLLGNGEQNPLVIRAVTP